MTPINLEATLLRRGLRSIAVALALLAVPVAPVGAASDPVRIQWKAEYGDLQLKAPAPGGSLCGALDVLVPVTASAVKAMKKLRLRLPPAFPGAAKSFVCQGTVYGAPDFCMVFSLRSCVDG